jgi:hypothetical protein
VRFDAIPAAEFPGVVRQISGYGETRQGEIVYPVKIDLQTTDERLRWNMTCAVTIQK